LKIQITKTKSFEWTPPWETESAALANDVVGIELNSGNPEGCPAVRLQKKKDRIHVAAVGFVTPPAGNLPNNWDGTRRQPKCQIPPALRANAAAFAVNSHDAVTRQTSAESLSAYSDEPPVVGAVSKDGVRSVSKLMADESSAIEASLPEYQALWVSRLLPEGKKPKVVSIQTAASTLLASLAAQPGFCRDSDEMAVFVTDKTIYIACFRRGLPLLFRECPGAIGVAALREAVRTTLGLDGAMLEAAFSSNSFIDTRPALDPFLSPVVSQVDISLGYLKSRLGSEPKRLFLMGNAVGCDMLKRVIGGRLSLPLETPNPFNGLELPAHASEWKTKYCVGEASSVFLTALGAALAVLEEDASK